MQSGSDSMPHEEDEKSAQLYGDKSILEDSGHAVEQDDTILRNQVWSRLKIWMWIGCVTPREVSSIAANFRSVALMWTIFGLDNWTTYNYQNYAVSEFREISYLGALTTAGTIASAVLKPPVAKISDVIGRAQTYCIAVVLYIVSYAVQASAKQFDQYAGGYIIYCVGQTSMQILNQLIVADNTNSRWRGLANGLVNIPFIILPWIAAFIADSAIATIGWRWGIGMMGFIVPGCSIALVVPLLVFQKRMARAGHKLTQRVGLFSFASQVDFGGMVLLAAGFALLLLPLALAGSTPSRWSTPWIPALVAVGAVLLISLIAYEAKVARHPLVPPRYLLNRSLVLVWLMGTLDALAYSATHTYLYTYATTTHGYGPRNATFLTQTAACMQTLTGLIVGALMYKTRRFKWIFVIGVFVRLIGYGVMLRLRGATNGDAELFIVQIAQGLGSGIVQSILLVVAQIVVPRDELAQSTALELLFIYLGNAIGSTAAGAIYTNSFRPRLRHHFPQAMPAEVDAVINTLTETTYALDSPQRTAINRAYSDVIRYMTWTALGTSIGGVVLVWGLPDLRLGEMHNLAQTEASAKEQENEQMSGESKAAYWWRTAKLR